jgi:pimeloyl-ACP methyl ester carboxylesterase
MLTIVLLPGMDGTGQLFAPFISALGSEFNVHVIQYPTVGALGYEELEAIAKKQLPSTGCFVILGESFSGPIAISLAASQPPGLVGLVLCSSFARNPHPAFAVLDPLVRVLPVKLAPLALLSHLLMGQFATPALRSSLSSALAQVSTSTFRARVKAVLSCDASAKLKTINVPLMYLLAVHDRVVPADAAKHVARIMPSTQIVPIDAPHFLLQAAPTAAANVVGAFMRQVQNSVEPVHAAYLERSVSEGSRMSVT